jgi:hypothetical protein
MKKKALIMDGYGEGKMNNKGCPIAALCQFGQKVQYSKAMNGQFPHTYSPAAISKMEMESPWLFRKISGQFFQHPLLRINKAPVKCE